MEYASSVRVQRGTATQSSTIVNVNLASAVNMSRTFVLLSKTAGAGDSIYSRDDPITVELRSANQLRIRTSGGNNAHRIAWQVVEFTNPGDITVYRGSTSLTRNGWTQRTVSIGGTVGAICSSASIAGVLEHAGFSCGTNAHRPTHATQSG